MRILSGLCGAVVLLSSAVFTLGTSLAAPLGMFVVRRRAQQRGRPITRFGSWLGAAIASSIAVAVALLVVFAFIPRSMYQEIQKGAVEARARDTARTPAWMTKTFPRSARADSTTQQIVNSTAFLVIGGALGLGFACLFFGAISGSVGWVGAVLLGYALTGVAPP